ncbi:hypothetical protein SNOG_04172 [Parastagonospora nodorum SN15]|uniref:Uncharacterized protein n=1 Tax=Phaeosphaeria nodorum (strain SN15 / ATCC MYA-4574 / FGSC 10173) TaxID=321614 RepID=Q0UVP2_PHANO|nr:hypothetical protein SNOG_04172 [Parastagonospora nodorum SN15]EAT87932.1 hypothetical protein SNOG_04172 [Parastagonospora nodorum SN15]
MASYVYEDESRVIVGLQEGMAKGDEFAVMWQHATWKFPNAEWLAFWV